MNSVVQEWSRLIALVSLILKAWGSSFAVYCVCWCSRSGFFFSFGYFVVSICGLIFSRRSLWDSLGSAWEYCSEERFYIYLWLVLRDTSVLRLLMLVSCPEDPRLTGNVDLISKPKWRSATNYESSGRVLLFPFFFFFPTQSSRGDERPYGLVVLGLVGGGRWRMSFLAHPFSAALASSWLRMGFSVPIPPYVTFESKMKPSTLFGH